MIAEAATARLRQEGAFKENKDFLERGREGVITTDYPLLIKQTMMREQVPLFGVSLTKAVSPSANATYVHEIMNDDCKPILFLPVDE